MYFTVITKGCRTKLNFVAGKFRSVGCAPQTLEPVDMRAEERATVFIDPGPVAYGRRCKRVKIQQSR
jgi:hypothetical protein